MIDPVTGINNNKGMINSYSNKKNLKDSNFTAKMSNLSVKVLKNLNLILQIKVPLS